MVVKNIDLIVLEEEKISKIPLAAIYTADLPERTYLINPQIYAQEPFNQYHHPNFLIHTYFNSLEDTKRLFQQILKDDLDMHKTYCQHLIELPFAYATPEAYEKENAPTKSIAYYGGRDEGIIISLAQISEKMRDTAVHEFGHFMHEILSPGRYEKCDGVMKELMAIFVEEKADYQDTYEEQHPDHYKAQKLLHQLNEIYDYKTMDTAAQWNFLVGFMSHENLDEYVTDTLR